MNKNRVAGRNAPGRSFRETNLNQISPIRLRRKSSKRLTESI